MGVKFEIADVLGIRKCTYPFTANNITLTFARFEKFEFPTLVTAIGSFSTAWDESEIRNASPLW